MPMLEFFIAGGIVAYPLLILSVLSIALIAERAVFWWRIQSHQPRLIRDVLKIYAEDPHLAIHRLKQQANLPMARIFLEALALDRPNPDEFRLALESAAQAEIPFLKRFSVAFETTITVSPLLGLLGTILGLIRSFSALKIGQVSGENAVGVTGGISEALISTVMGLVVAIFTLMFANLFRGIYQRQLALIQEYGGQLELLYRRQMESKGQSVMAK
ncbi:MAG: MotA/TolQ/ExbB proton channel family protein [Chloroflexaceae bacterium]|nr:MotA/TolQ/ExbB proton channel family protein [Chloroflexaceae bacterium]